MQSYPCASTAGPPGHVPVPDHVHGQESSLNNRLLDSSLHACRVYAYFDNYTYSNSVLHLRAATAWHTNRTMPLSELTVAQDQLLVLVHDYKAAEYAIVASTALLYYDSLLTFSQEVDLVWRRHLGWGKILYIVTRYFSLFALTFNTAVHLNNTAGHEL
ncbi:hypothetical protein JB92DRAFT_1662961 [Gautieria morchelliformis]|nr:hypothetical protein JB92DRAFT_1662961 [Gautieria morchelliformis]